MKCETAGDFWGGHTGPASALPTCASLKRPSKSKRILSIMQGPCQASDQQSHHESTLKRPRTPGWTLLCPQQAACPNSKDTPSLARIWARESSQALVEEGTKEPPVLGQPSDGGESLRARPMSASGREAATTVHRGCCQEGPVAVGAPPTSQQTPCPLEASQAPRKRPRASSGKGSRWGDSRGGWGMGTRGRSEDPREKWPSRTGRNRGEVW